MELPKNVQTIINAPTVRKIRASSLKELGENVEQIEASLLAIQKAGKSFTLSSQPVDPKEGPDVKEVRNMASLHVHVVFVDQVKSQGKATVTIECSNPEEAKLIEAKINPTKK